MAYTNDPRHAPAMQRPAPPQPHPARDRAEPRYGAYPRAQRAARVHPHAREVASMHAEMVHESYKADRRRTGIRDIVGGLVLIGIGLAYGGSIFMGTADVIDWAFDLLGTFWLVKGIYMLVT